MRSRDCTNEWHNSCTGKVDDDLQLGCDCQCHYESDGADQSAQVEDAVQFPVIKLKEAA